MAVKRNMRRRVRRARSAERLLGWVLARGVFRNQAHDPSGPAGHVVVWILGRRSSNVQRNRWAVELLEVQPTDRVIELGCGPGVAVAALADRATRGLVVGVDQSGVVIVQARRRNKDAIEHGRVRLIHAPVERMQVTDGPFDAALAVNTVGMWPEPTTRLREIGRLLRPGGRIALVSQPRCPGASAATSAAAADGLVERLADAGFVDLRVETLDLDPPAVCVLAKRAIEGRRAKSRSAEREPPRAADTDQRFAKRGRL